jgi:hypothetical protein
VLRYEDLRAPLLTELAGVDRLVLLGDVIELRQGPVRDAVAGALGVLREIGAAVGGSGEIVIVPGNHDHHLAAGWLQRRAWLDPPAPLGLESAVEWAPTDMLARIAGALAPARVRAAYPGVWLREDIYAMHGHYGDRHTTVPMFERLGAGVMARIVNEPEGGPRRPEDYERILAPIYAWIFATAEDAPKPGASSHGPSARAWRALAGRGGRRSVRGRGLAAALPAIVAGLNLARLGPLRSDVSTAALHRGGLRAFDESIVRLEVPARYAIFGHTHRAGPLARDDEREWRAGNGATLLNSGCWLYEPRYLGRSPRSSPYRPGFGVVIEDSAPPELKNLLDEVLAARGPLTPAQA